MGETTLNSLAYTDDLCILCKDKAKLTPVLVRVNAFAQWANLAFNISKCRSLTMVNCEAKRYVNSFQPTLGSGFIPGL